jgi:hypothetical protein
MSEESCRSISLLLPVFRGGELFLGAIKSIEDTSIAFDNVFISFNGVTSTDYEAFLELEKSGRLKKKYRILTTYADLDASQHGLFILKNLDGQLHPESMLFLLAHDDRIIFDEKEEVISNSFFSMLNCKTVYFPSYNCCTAGDYENVTHVIESEVLFTSDQFFWLTLRENVATNMSGMIVPFAAWKETLEVMSRSGTGARFEHLLCIAKSVCDVQFNKNVRVLIGERPDSDGKSLTMLQHRKAAFYYVLTYMRNGRLTEVDQYIRYAFEFSKKVVAYVLCKILDDILPKLSGR